MKTIELYTGETLIVLLKGRQTYNDYTRKGWDFPLSLFLLLSKYSKDTNLYSLEVKEVEKDIQSLIE